MTTYRYKSSTVEALQLTMNNIPEVMIFAGEESDLNKIIALNSYDDFKKKVEKQGFFLLTSEGITRVKVGDYVLRVGKTLFVRKPAEFEAKYELVGDDKTMDERSAMSRCEQVYEDVWKEHLEYKNGEIDRDALKKELADYHMLLREVTKAYSELSGFSKPHTRAQVIIDAVNERMVDKQTAFDDLLLHAENDEVVISVKDLAEYLDVPYTQSYANGMINVSQNLSIPIDKMTTPIKGTLNGEQLSEGVFKGDITLHEDPQQLDTLYSAKGTVPIPNREPNGKITEKANFLKGAWPSDNAVDNGSVKESKSNPNGLPKPSANNDTQVTSKKGPLISFIESQHMGSGCSAKAYPANQVPGWAGTDGHPDSPLPGARAIENSGNHEEQAEDPYDKVKRTIRFYEDEVVALNDGGVELNGERIASSTANDRVLNILIRSIIQMVN